MPGDVKFDKIFSTSPVARKLVFLRKAAEGFFTQRSIIYSVIRARQESRREKLRPRGTGARRTSLETQENPIYYILPALLMDVFLKGPE